jgi:hypothetical protein
MGRTRDADGAGRSGSRKMSLADLPDASAAEWEAEDELPPPDVPARPSEWWITRVAIVGGMALVGGVVAWVLVGRSGASRPSSSVVEIVAGLEAPKAEPAGEPVQTGAATAAAVQPPAATDQPTGEEPAPVAGAGTDTDASEGSTGVTEAAPQEEPAVAEPEEGAKPRSRKRSRRRRKPEPEPAAEPAPAPEPEKPKPKPKPKPKALSPEEKVLAACRRKDRAGARSALKAVARKKRRGLKRKCKSLGVKL